MPGSARNFRVFVSSTFADLKAERNALQARAFPQLQELCRQHGARFQAVDLRWGVSEEASLDQQAMRICLQELQRCQQVTPHPNFIVLLGQRYGWRPVPASIPASEFEPICQATADASDRTLLKRWYVRDDNAVPPEYLLQRREGVEADPAHWAVVEGELRRVLLAALPALHLPEAARVKYERSATEQEILAGALAADVPHAFLYRRHIAGLPPEASIFRDGDAEAEERLADLVKRLGESLPEDHRHTYDATWQGTEPGNDHLAQLCEDVYHDLSTAILAQLAEEETADALSQEINAHQAFGAERAHGFFGRQDAIERIREYLHDDAPRPLLLHGVSGSGKSALLAECVQQATAKFSSDTVLVSRFIGATPVSTELRTLLESLCQQLCRAYGLDESTVPAEVKALIADFSQRLALATAQRPLLLVLDALDQLNPGDGAHYLHWLPQQLPPHVRLVISVLERDDVAGACLRAARGRLKESPFLEIRPFTVGEGNALLAQWLADDRRTLTQEQFDHIHACFAGCPYPLYLKFAFAEARRWKSFDSLLNLNAETSGIILDLLARLEAPAQHGALLVRKALGLLAAARHGLTEDELLDVLSADEELWTYVVVSAHHELSERRLPWVLWSRLRGDLEPYLMERAADGASLLGFYHRQVGEAAAVRYLIPEIKPLAHQALARYFLPQAYWLEAVEGTRRPNLRQLAELAYQLTLGGMWEELAATLTTLAYPEAKHQAGLLFDLADDYRSAWRALPAAHLWRLNLRLLEQALRRHLHFIDRHREDFPAALFQCAWNEAWWYDTPAAAKYYNPPKQGWGAAGAPWEHGEPRLCTLLERWRAEKEAREPGFCWLRSHRPPAFPLGGAELACFRGHEGAVTCVACSPDGTRIVSGSSDRTVRVWDAESGAELACLRGHKDEVSCVACSPDGTRIVSGSRDRTVRVWDAGSGDELACLRRHKGDVTSVACSPNGTRIVSGSRDRTVRVWDAVSRSEPACFRGHEGGVTSVACSPDGTRIVLGSDDRTVRVWDAVSGAELACLRGHEEEVSSVACSPDGKWIVSGSGGCELQDNSVRLWDNASGAEMACLHGHEGWVTSVVFSPDGTRIVSGSWDNTVRVWDALSGAELACLRGSESWVTSVAYSPVGVRVVLGSWDQTVRVLDAASGAEQVSLRGHENIVTTMVFSPAGAMIVSGSRDNNIWVWDTASGGAIACLRGHQDVVECAACSLDGTRIVSGSWDQTVRVWDTASGDELACLHGHKNDVICVAFSSDGARIVSGSSDNTVRVWDIASGAELACLHGHENDVISVAFSPGGARIVSGSSDNTVRVWDTASGAELVCLHGHENWVWSIAFSPDGARIVSGSTDETMRVWDAISGACLEIIHGLGDAAAIAAGTKLRPFRAHGYMTETVIECSHEGQSVAAFDIPLAGLTSDPHGQIWAGCHAQYIEIIHLEGLLPTGAGAEILELAGPPQSVAGESGDVAYETILRRGLECRRQAQDNQGIFGHLAALSSLLEKAGRRDEAAQFHREYEQLEEPCEVERQKARTRANGHRIQYEVLDCYETGDYTGAKLQLLELLEAQFELPDTLCHLAYIALVTEDVAAAREYSTQAWTHRAVAPPYILPRILWLQLVCAQLEGDAATVAPLLGRLKMALQADSAIMEWTMDPVLAHLQTQLPAEAHSLFTALVAAMSFPEKLIDLDQFPAWQEADAITLE